VRGRRAADPSGRGSRGEVPDAGTLPCALSRREILPAGGIAVVVAHADDESVGIGAQLARMPDVTLVHVTDSAPKRGADARAKGFADARSYALARRRELQAAMALVGVPRGALLELGAGDQEAAFHLVPLALRLADILERRKIRCVFTHCYEGGHPDHDATSFIAHIAADVLARRGGRTAPRILEMPFYRAGPQGWIIQDFADDGHGPGVAVTLDEEERTLKARLYAAHATQADVLQHFPIAVERFRPAPRYDFARLPNGGDVFYERQPFGLTGAQWVRLAAEARSEMERRRCL
jgi:LmbE family N-acetylglucosaminyl deacetylase